MKTKQIVVAGLALAVLSSFNAHLATALAQGALTPPGAPAPTMKTLDQIEPRAPISSAPFTISQPGSYYLTTNVTVSSGDAITINANDVTLDLNGFTIASTATSANGVGIRVGGTLRVTNVTILDGIISGGVTNNGSGVYSGSGFGYGIDYTGGLGLFNGRVKDVSVYGCQYNGIEVGVSSTVVESCTVRTVGGNGIVAQDILRSAATDCGGMAIDAGATASDCAGISTGSGPGVNANAGEARNCYAISSTGDGLDANTAENCYGYSSGGSGNGVSATYTALNCYGYAYSGDGVLADTAMNCEGFSEFTGYGVYANDTAIGCYGSGSFGGGLHAFIADVCHGLSSSGTALDTTHNVNSY